MRRENERTRTIIQITRIGGGDGSRLLEHGFQRFDLVGSNLLVLLILDDDGISLSSVDNGDGGNLGGESSRGPGGGRSAVRLESVVILLLSRDFVSLGRLLSTVVMQRSSALLRAMSRMRGRR